MVKIGEITSPMSTCEIVAKVTSDYDVYQHSKGKLLNVHFDDGDAIKLTAFNDETSKIDKKFQVNRTILSFIVIFLCIILNIH